MVMCPGVALLVMTDVHGGSTERAHANSATQRCKLPTSYYIRKRRGLGTHRLLQSARDTAEKKEGEGGANDAGEPQKGEK
jgi:hypothetical protein